MDGPAELLGGYDLTCSHGEGCRCMERIKSGQAGVARQGERFAQKGLIPVRPAGHGFKEGLVEGCLFSVLVEERFGEHLEAHEIA